MAERNTQENIEPLNSITGNFNRSKQLYYQLKEDFKTAQRVTMLNIWQKFLGIPAVAVYSNSDGEYGLWQLRC